MTGMSIITRMSLSLPDLVIDQIAGSRNRLGKVKALVGLDGFVDTIIHVVGRRESARSYARMGQMSEFGRLIGAAAGLSASTELSWGPLRSIAWTRGCRGPQPTTTCGIWWRRAWCVKWQSRAAPRDSMQRPCGTITSSATAAATLRTWNGTTCLCLPRAHWVSELFANANSSSGGCAPSAPRPRYASVRRWMNP